MIDYLSLAIGHGLLAIAFFRLVLSQELDVDSSIQEYVDQTEAEREAARRSGRNAARRKGAEPSSSEAIDQGDAS